MNVDTIFDKVMYGINKQYSDSRLIVVSFMARLACSFFEEFGIKKVILQYNTEDESLTLEKISIPKIFNIEDFKINEAEVEYKNCFNEDDKECLKNIERILTDCSKSNKYYGSLFNMNAVKKVDSRTGKSYLSFEFKPTGIYQFLYNPNAVNYISIDKNWYSNKKLAKLKLKQKLENKLNSNKTINYKKNKL